MSKELSDTVVLNAQKTIYQVKDSLQPLRDAVQEKERELAEAENRLRHAEQELRDWADFLTEHSPDTNECWYAEVGLEPPE